MVGFGAGLRAVIRDLALNLESLRVNIVSPGPVDSLFWAPRQRHMLGRQPWARLGQWKRCAEAYVYLMKDTNATGSCISTDDGFTLL